jgi:hypothetical protein
MDKNIAGIDIHPIIGDIVSSGYSIKPVENKDFITMAIDIVINSGGCNGFFDM